MYFPKNAAEMKEILADLERFARLEGMHRLSESLADARFHLSACARRGDDRDAPERDEKLNT